MPALFDNFGIRFEYPDNWSVEQQPLDPVTGQGGQVIVTSPETAFWHLSRYSRDTQPETLFDEALSAIRSEHREMEVLPANDQIENQSLAGYDVSFFCFELTSTATLRAFQTADATYLIISQAEDGELQRVASVFQAMLTSTLRNLTADRSTL